MIVQNRQIIEGMPFDDYLKLPGISYSFIKNGGISIPLTPKMRLGIAVETFVFEPAKYDGHRYDEVRRLAGPLIQMYGPLLKGGKSQLTVTADFIFGNMTMKYKGRIDHMITNLVTDLKVSQLGLLQAINHFGYDKQLNGYALGADAAGSILISIKDRGFAPPEIRKMNIPNCSTWWEQKVLEYGTPL